MNEKGSRWHLATPLSVCQSLHTDAACGLSLKAARSRFKKQGRNPLFDDVASKRKSPIKSLLLDPALLLMLFSAILTILFLSPLQIVCTVVVCALLTFALLRVWYKCEEFSRTVAQYRTPTVRVLRDGRVFSISAARVVQGDVLLFGAGDIVPGDCRLLSSQDLRVLTLLPNETGRPIYREYTKRADVTYEWGTHVDAPLAENMLFGGSEILCGEARAVLVATGLNSYLGAMRSFTLPAEIQEKHGQTPTQRLIGPYLRIWGLLSFVILTLLTVIGLFTTPTEGGLAEYFFILCVLVGVSSPATLSLYLHWVSVRGRLLCLENNPPKNRAVIKSEGGVQKLAGVTDLFVIGKRGLSDGITHFWSAFVANKEIRADAEGEKSDLYPLCEAMLLRHELDMRMPSTNGSGSSESDTVFLSELTSLCRFDVGALRVRTQAVEGDTYPNHPSWQCVMATLQEGSKRYLFDSSGSLLRQCVLYADGVRMRAITPEYRAILKKYCNYIEENGCRALCIATEKGEGTLALVGVVALREEVSMVLPSVVEELALSGIPTRFFLSDDDYAKVCHLPEPYLYCNDEHPKLTPTLLQNHRTFIGFSKEELSALLPTLQKSGHRIAVLGGSTNDRCFLRAGILTFACDTVTDFKQYAEENIREGAFEEGREGSRNTSQTLRRHADVIIERADRFAGGVYAALQTISHSREVEVRTQMLLQFWLHSQLARIVLMLFAVCTGIGFFSSLQMFLSGFAIEIAALYFLSDVPLSQSVLRRPNTTDKTFLFGTLFAKELLIPTILSIAIPALTSVILAFVGVLPRGSIRTYFFVSLLLLQICVLLRITYRAQVRPETKKTLLICGISVGVLAVLILLSVLIAPVGAITGMGAWNPLTACLLPLTPALYFILNLLVPFLGRTAK